MFKNKLHTASIVTTIIQRYEHGAICVCPARDKPRALDPLFIIAQLSLKFCASPITHPNPIVQL